MTQPGVNEGKLVKKYELGFDSKVCLSFICDLVISKVTLSVKALV